MNTNFWESLANSPLIENLGWTLVHSVWQFLLIAFVLLAVTRALQKFSANVRYLAAVAALVCALILPIVTFVVLNTDSSPRFLRKEVSFEPQSEQFGGRLQKPENLSPPAQAEATTVETRTENVLASIKSLQSFFDENFSSLLPFIVGLWLLGVAFFALRLTGGIWQTHLYKTRQVQSPGGDWQQRLATLCEKLEISKTVRLLQSGLVQTPIVVGWFKPVILVPASVFLQITPKELETVLAHELIHIRRCDALVNFTQGIIEVLFFYHPCVWWISTVIRREREFATDEAVIKTLENSHIVYASALANLEEIRLSSMTNQTLSPSTTTAANGGNLMQRITKILQKNTETRGRANSAWSAGLALVLISAFVLAVFSFNQLAFVNAQTSLTKTKNKKMAIGFVSLPPVDRTANPPKDSDATSRLLIEKLKARKIPAIGFVTGGAISDGEKFYPVRANIVRLWRDAGFEIGIGNFKHVWFYHTPYDEYVAGVEKNESVVRKLLAEKNLPLRYFSYPYLNTGKNAEEHQRFESWLQARGLSSIKYTFDNQEWMYSYAYDTARNDNDINTMREIREAFVAYMSKMLAHYEAYSQEIFGRHINQTMVLTPSRLITDSADELFEMMEKRGYQFVSMDEAQADEAYRTEENFYGKSGISWFERWQMAKGKKLRAEPEVDALVEKIWNENKSKK